MRTAWMMIGLLAVAGSVASAQPVFVVPDEPTDLPEGAPLTFFKPWEVVKNDSGTYSLQATSTTETFSDVKIDAAWEIYDTRWIVSVADAVDLGGQRFRRSDIFDWNSSTNNFVLQRSQENAGIPDGSNLDAIFRDPRTDELVVSFDDPTTWGGDTFMPADLIRYDFDTNSVNGWFFDASEYGIPDSTNLTAAQARGTVPCGDGDMTCTLTVFSLDEPTTIDSTTYLPGDLLSWNGTNIALFQAQPGWPISTQVNALSFRGAPGIVPPTIRVGKVNPTTLRISYASTPCSGLEHHGIYQGNLATVRTGLYDHEPIDCLDNGVQLEENVPMPAQDSYFLVVPNSQTEEGSYGTRSDGDQRPVGSNTKCESIQNLEEC